MSWTLVTTAGFDHRVRKFLNRHPDLWPRFIETLERLPTDPFDPSLRLHQLGGKFKDMQAVSLTYSYRIVLIL